MMAEDGKKGSTIAIVTTGEADLVVHAETLLICGAGIDIGRRPTVEVDLATMNAILAMAPRIAYANETRLSIAEEAEDLVASTKLEDPDGGLAASLAEALKARFAEHEGEPAASDVLVVIDGMNHVHHAAEPWYDAFETAMAEEFDALLTRIEDAAERASGVVAIDMRIKADALLADPRFGAPKVTRAKREFLASQLHPDLPAKAIDAIVTLAENVAWMGDVAHLAPGAASEDAPAAPGAQAG